MNTTILNSRCSIFQWLLTVVGLAGIPALFLPFASGVSPAAAALDQELWQLAIPFFLSVLVSSASLRWIVSGTLSRPERAIAYFVSVAMAFVTLTFYRNVDAWPSGVQDWLLLTIPVSTLILGVHVVSRNRRKGTLKESSALMAVQVAYVANCLMCVIGFVEYLEIGAYFALVTAVAYSVQTALVFVQGRAAQEQPAGTQG